MLERFDFATYREILRWASRHRPCVGFPEAVALEAGPYCIVRHDIDFSLSAALRMAEVEAELGVKATYFLLFGAGHYDLLAPANTGVPRALVALGHEVGLHYDSAAVACVAPTEAVAILRAQAALLGALSGRPVQAVARHNPGFGGSDPLAAEAGFINAYDQRLTRDIAYVSDSCGAWRPEAHDVLGAPEPPRRLQLLTHPLFWDAQALDRWTHLDELHRTQIAEIDARAAYTRDVWSRHPAVAEYDRRVHASGSPG